MLSYPEVKVLSQTVKGILPIAFEALHRDYGYRGHDRVMCLDLRMQVIILIFIDYRRNT